MSFFSRKADAKTQLVETNQPEAKPAPLRDVLVEKLVGLAREGNVQAIRELLDRPQLIEPQPVPVTRLELLLKLREMLTKWLVGLGIEATDENLFGFLFGHMPDLTKPTPKPEA